MNGVYLSGGLCLLVGLVLHFWPRLRLSDRSATTAAVAAWPPTVEPTRTLHAPAERSGPAPEQAAPAPANPPSQDIMGVVAAVLAVVQREQERQLRSTPAPPPPAPAPPPPPPEPPAAAAPPPPEPAPPPAAPAPPEAPTPDEEDVEGAMAAYSYDLFDDDDDRGIVHIRVLAPFALIRRCGWLEDREFDLLRVAIKKFGAEPNGSQKEHKLNRGLAPQFAAWLSEQGVRVRATCGSKLAHMQEALMTVLRTECGAENVTCIATVRLAERLDVCDRQVRIRLSQLEGLGYIRRPDGDVRGRRICVYPKGDAPPLPTAPTRIKRSGSRGSVDPSHADQTIRDGSLRDPPAPVPAPAAPTTGSGTTTAEAAPPAPMASSAAGAAPAPAAHETEQDVLLTGAALAPSASAAPSAPGTRRSPGPSATGHGSTDAAATETAGASPEPLSFETTMREQLFRVVPAAGVLLRMLSVCHDGEGRLVLTAEGPEVGQAAAELLGDWPRELAELLLQRQIAVEWRSKTDPSRRRVHEVPPRFAIGKQTGGIHVEAAS